MIRLFAFTILSALIGIASAPGQGIPPDLMRQVYDRIDPKRQLPDGQRIMAAYSTLHRFHMHHGELEKAETAALGMLMQHRLNIARYHALVRAAETGGTLDAVAQSAARTLTKMPTGRDLKIENLGGRLVLTATDEKTGQVVRSGVWNPEELCALVTGFPGDRCDQAIVELAGERGEQFKQDPPNPSSSARKSAPSHDSARKISMGSGFFVTTEGHALTNAHVVEGCQELTVRSVDGTRTSASILARSQTDDLALLKSAARVASAAPLRVSPPPRTGETIMVYGFPLSGLLTSAGNATAGNISALAGLRNHPGRLQISAPVQPGSSGGPLLDMGGNVIGIVVSKLDALRIASVTEDIPQNVNFAVKASVAKDFLDAHSIAYTANSGSSKTLPAPDVVERAKTFSVEVSCQK